MKSRGVVSFRQLNEELHSSRGVVSFALWCWQGVLFRRDGPQVLQHTGAVLLSVLAGSLVVLGVATMVLMLSFSEHAHRPERVGCQECPSVNEGCQEKGRWHLISAFCRWIPPVELVV